MIAEMLVHGTPFGFGGPGRVRNATVFRTWTGAALLAGIVLAGAGPAKAEIVTEDFQAYPVQSDTTGSLFSDPEEGDEILIFRITTTGATGPSDPIVAIVGEALAASAGIGAENGNQFWTLGSSAGQTGVIDGKEGFLLIGDIPLDFEGLPTGGPFGEFFSVPQNLTGGTISAQVRATTASPASQFQFLLAEPGVAGREIVTATFPLTTAFQTFTVPISAFTIPFDPGEGPFDFTKVISVGFEFFAAPGTAPAFSFNVDDSQIDAPEPAKAMPWLLLLLDD